MPEPHPTPLREHPAETRLRERRRHPVAPSDAPLPQAAAAALAGAAAWPWLGPGPWLAPAGWLLAASLLGVWALARRRGADSVSAVALLASIAALSGAWMDAALGLRSSRDVAHRVARVAGPAAIVGEVVEPPVERAANPRSPFRAIPSTDRTVVRLRVTAIREGVRWQTASGGCVLTVSGRHGERLRPGARVRAFAQLRRPEPATGPGQRDADLAARARGYAAVGWAEAGACVTPLRAGTSLAADWFDRAQRRAREAIRTRINGRAGAVAAAVSLGDRGGLDSETVERFRRAGLLHVLVVSGLHVGLVAAWGPFLAAAGWAPRRLGWLIGLASAVAYAALSGGATPTVRAALVVAAGTVAAISGRRALGLAPLSAAAIALLVATPGAWAEPGTQLSFLATATLLAVARVWRRRHSQPLPPLERLIRRCESAAMRTYRRMRATALATAAASTAVFVAVAPLVSEAFHLLSWVSVPMSLLAALLTPVIVLAGIATAVVDALAVSGAPLLGALCDTTAFVCGSAAWLLAGTTAVVADTPAAAWHTPGPPAGWVGAWVAWLAASGAAWVAHPRVWRRLLPVLLVMVVWWAAPVALRGWFPPTALRCDVIAVGHGAATLVRAPGGGAVLVDAGALGEPDVVADRLARALWARGVARLDAVLLSHPDVDHYNGLPGLLDRFDIGGVATTEGMFPVWEDPDDRSGPAALRRLLAQRGVPVTMLRTGQRLPLGGASLLVLHPSEWDPTASDNANSLVVAIEHAGRRVLLPGDLEGSGLRRLLATEPYDCDVLVAPHHGSSRSDPPGFAAWCRPERVAISSGRPSPTAARSYRHAGASVATTHDLGDLAFLLTRQNVAATPFRPPSSRLGR